MGKQVEGRDYSCPKCGHQNWEYIDDNDNGDWVEASYECLNCHHIIYVELED